MFWLEVPAIIAVPVIALALTVKEFLQASVR